MPRGFDTGHHRRCRSSIVSTWCRICAMPWSGSFSAIGGTSTPWALLGIDPRSQLSPLERLTRRVTPAGSTATVRFSSCMPSAGEFTPPTKLQTFFFEVCITRIRIDPKHDIDLIPGYVYPLHEGTDEVPFVRPIRGLQAVVDVGRKVFQTANDQLQFCVHSRLICQLLALLLQTGDPLAQAGQPRLKFGLVDEPLRVTVDSSCDTLPQLADLLFDRRKRRAFCAALRLQAAPIFLRQSLRVSQQRTDFLPDGQVQQIRPDLGIRTDALATKAIRIRPPAAVIRVRAGGALPGPRAEALAIIGIATLLALHQTWQEIERTAARLPGVPLILPQWFLDRGKHVGLDEGRDGDGEPLLLGHIDGRDGPPGRQRTPPMGAQARAQGFLARFAIRGVASIRRVLEHAPHR